MSYKLLFIFFICSVFTFRASEFQMINLTNNDGLSNSSVNTIVQTSNNLLWFGTWDGLNLYNGRDFKIFKPQLRNVTSISSNVIRNIIEENTHTYWIATDWGINKFDFNTQTFQHFFTDSHHPFEENSFIIAKNQNGVIFAGISGKGIFYFNKQKQCFELLSQTENFHPKKIFFDKENLLWCYTNEQKLLRIELNQEKNQKTIKTIVDFKKLNEIENVFYQENTIWLQTTDRKLYTYDISKGIITEISFPELKNIGKIKAFASDENYIFLGTEKGLFQCDIKTKNCVKILPNVSVFALCMGTQGVIWVGTDMQGVWQIVPKKENFKSFSILKQPQYGKSAVRAFLEDDDKKLWVGTKGEGIYLFENVRNADPIVMRERINTSNGLLNNSVYEIVKGNENEIWIGSDGRGINYYDTKNKQLYALKVPDTLQKKFNISSVYTILPIGKDILWVGTSGYGVYKLQIERSTQPYSIKKIKQFSFEHGKSKSLSNNIVYSIVKTDDNFLWIATRGGGLNRLDLRTETVEVFKHQSNQKGTISSNDIITLYKDKKGFLWAGTSIGLNKLLRFEGNTPIFKHFSEKEGMPNNTVHAILEDEQENIWVSTNQGIAKLTQEEHGHRIVSYYKKDGLQGNEFSDGAAYVSSDDNLFYFGGINGFSTFNPLRIFQNEYMPTLWLDAFYIDNQEKKLINYMNEKELILPYENKIFSFKFVPLDYLSSAKCEISYKIEGFQKDWVHLGTSNTIVLSNLPSGKYKLIVRCSNADKIWNENFYTLSFQISTPWWNATWAHISYVLLFLGLCWGIWSVIRSQIKARNDIKMKELEKQKIEEIHQAKLRFFTNIAHEFSNSLTLIYGPCEQLLRNSFPDEKTKKYVNVIKSNSKRMQELIQQLINFRKAETGHLRIKIERVDITELFRYVFDNFIEVLEHKKIRYELSFFSDPIVWQTDRSSVEKIIFNLISNAVKYTPDEQNIHVEARVENNNLFFFVTNTGVGIDQAFQQNIFNRFEVLNRFEHQISRGIELRNGIGLALCKSIVETLNGTIDLKSDGKTFTTFTVTLPQKELSLNSDNQEINESKSEKLQMEKGTGSIALNKKETESIENRNKKTVLIVDDEQDIRALIKDILEENYVVIEAANGAEAIDLAQRTLPSLIICDVMMPVMDGIEFLRVMKSQELTRYVPIVFLSSKNSVENYIQGIEVGADAYLGKPFHPKYLQVLIENILERKNQLIHQNETSAVAFECFEGKKVKKEDKDLMLKIINIIHDNLDNDCLSGDFIANELAISKMQLYRKIKEISEQTPTEYVRTIRLNQAEKLLKTTNKTVSEIMYGCGFNSKTYFYKEFFKKYGYTPKEYREVNQKDKVN